VFNFAAGAEQDRRAGTARLLRAKGRIDVARLRRGDRVSPGRSAENVNWPWSPVIVVRPPRSSGAVTLTRARRSGPPPSTVTVPLMTAVF
jgi:hypothetical protein